MRLFINRTRSAEYVSKFDHDKPCPVLEKFLLDHGVCLHSLKRFAEHSPVSELVGIQHTVELGLNFREHQLVLCHHILGFLLKHRFLLVSLKPAAPLHNPVMLLIELRNIESQFVVLLFLPEQVCGQFLNGHILHIHVLKSKCFFHLI